MIFHVYDYSNFYIGFACGFICMWLVEGFGLFLEWVINKIRVKRGKKPMYIFTCPFKSSDCPCRNETKEAVNNDKT